MDRLNGMPSRLITLERPSSITSPKVPSCRLKPDGGEIPVLARESVYIFKKEHLDLKKTSNVRVRGDELVAVRRFVSPSIASKHRGARQQSA
jgi:hypothetical protein